MKKLVYRASGVLLIWTLSSAEILAQCAMCRGTVESTIGNGRNNVGVGINTGIAYLFVIPYLSVGVIAYFWYKNSQRELQQRRMVEARVRRAMEN